MADICRANVGEGGGPGGVELCFPRARRRQAEEACWGVCYCHHVSINSARQAVILIDCLFCPSLCSVLPIAALHNLWSEEPLSSTDIFIIW